MRGLLLPLLRRRVRLVLLTRYRLAVVRLLPRELLWHLRLLPLSRCMRRLLILRALLILRRLRGRGCPLLLRLVWPRWVGTWLLRVRHTKRLRPAL